MDNLKLKEFFNRKYTYAVVGASNNKNKYGYKITKTLFEAGFNVIPINPKESEIYGIKCYPSLLAVSERIDVVDYVVPAAITLKSLKNAKERGINKVWFQPSSYDYKCETFCKKNNIKYMKDFCLFAQTLKELD